jgi:nucleoside-diphosphate-sugar epimerase
MAGKSSAPHHVAVVGASGVIGQAVTRHFATRSGWSVTAISRRTPLNCSGAGILRLELLDPEACRKAGATLRDVTHLVYCAVHETPGLVEGWHQQDHVDTNVAMLRNLFEPLLSSAPRLRQVILLQGTKAYGAHVEPIPSPARERWPRHEHRNFYFDQEDYLRTKSKGADWDWTILRPQVVFGDAIGVNMNPMLALAVYASVLAEQGRPLDFPGGPYFGLAEATDANLIAQACQWAFECPTSANETFNVTNGDVFSWRGIWPTIAAALGMEVGADAPASLAEMLPVFRPAWTEIAQRYHLRAPALVDAFVGQSLIYTDLLIRLSSAVAGPPVLLSTIKIRQAGFEGCIDTEDMLRNWFDTMRANRLLPPTLRTAC